MTWECVTCTVPQTLEPAAQTLGGPQCRACVADDKRLVAKLRKQRKKRKKRGKR